MTALKISLYMYNIIIVYTFMYELKLARTISDEYYSVLQWMKNKHINKKICILQHSFQPYLLLDGVIQSMPSWQGRCFWFQFSSQSRYHAVIILLSWINYMRSHWHNYIYSPYNQISRSDLRSSSWCVKITTTILQLACTS